MTLPGFVRTWRQERALAPWRVWRRQTLATLLSLVPPDAPYQYDTALSFLQPDRLDLAHPARLDLFFPERESLLLAVDALGPDSRPRYRDAAPYIARAAWERRRAHLEYRGWLLAEFRCPYLAVSDDEATDAVALAARLKVLTPL